MRKKFILFALIPLAALIVVVYIFMDSWIESALEYTGENIVGAKVEISNLHVNFSPLGLEWSKIEVANPKDPWKNLFQTGKVKLAIDEGQLLRGKYIIDAMEVHDLIIGTKRKTDGSLPSTKSKQSVLLNAQNSFSNTAKDALQKTLKSSPIFDMTKLKKGFNVDSLIRSFNFKTLKQIDTLKFQVEKTSKQWNAVQDDFENSKKRLIDIQNNIKSINPSNLNNIQSITSTIATIDNSIKSVNEIKQTIYDRSSSITSDIESLGNSVGSLDDLAKEDFQNLKNMAKLPSLNAPSLASLIAGSEMYKKAVSYLYWVDFVRTNVKKHSPEPEYTSPPRMKGQNINFPVKRGYPKFWIKKIFISGGTDSSTIKDFIRAKGEIKNISSDQSITGVPFTVNLEGTYNNAKALKLSAIFDRTKALPDDEYSASFSGVPVGEFELGRSNFLPTKISNAVMATTLKISVPGNRFDSNIDFKFNNVNLQFETQPKNIAERLVREVLTGIKELEINLRIWNTKGSFDAALSTNLDNQLANQLSKVVGAELLKLQNELKDKFNSFVLAKQNQFESLYKTKIGEINNQLNSYQSLVDENLKIIDSKKKELNDKLEKLKSNVIENKLKDLFKK